MSGPVVAATASAVLGTPAAPGRFPAVGILRKMTVSRDVNTGKGPITAIAGLQVDVDEIRYLCGWSGAFGQEVESVGGDGSTLIGRSVKVESLGGQLFVAYTVNRSSR